MDRAQAIRLVDKLQALATDRAATEAEKALARAKADALSARFRLGVAEKRHPRQQTQRRYRARRVWVASAGPGWTIDASAEGSPNVKLRHYWDRSDWKITIEFGWWTRGASGSAVATGRSSVRTSQRRRTPPGG